MTTPVRWLPSGDTPLHREKIATFGSGFQGYCQDEGVNSSQWRQEDGCLRRDLVFADFATAFAFMTRVAAEAERLDHHPDWSNSWNKVSISLVSHDVGRVTERDHRLAEAIDRLLSESHD